MDQHSIIVILSALLAISEALGLIPGLQSNSILGMVMNIIKWAIGALSAPSKQ